MNANGTFTLRVSAWAAAASVKSPTIANIVTVITDFI